MKIRIKHHLRSVKLNLQNEEKLGKTWLEDMTIFSAIFFANQLDLLGGCNLERHEPLLKMASKPSRP